MKELIFYLTLFFFIPVNQSLAQNPPISPKWVFEPWVWEDAVNTKDATWDLINGYLNRDIPVGAVIIDSPWEEPIDSGYNTFEFAPRSYSHPKAFIDSLNTKGIHVILWITGVMTTDCPLYIAALENNYFVNGGATTSFWKGNGRASHIDFFDSAALAYWESLMDQVFDSLEVDGWKVDESDYNIKELGTIQTADGDKTQRQYSDAYYSEMYNYIHTKRGDKGMIMARPYCTEINHTPYWFAPVTVNTVGWVGDKYSTWDGLVLALNNMFISANAGYATVGSDIGGYKDNTTPQNKNLFLRWTQLGSLLPVMENGGKTDDHHMPWLFDNNTVQIYRYFAELHHELVPYFYSYDILAHLTGTSIVRPFGNRGISDTTAWNGDWNYMLGDNLFVAAIYQDNNSRTITFPEGSSWIDYWNDSNKYQGGSTETLNYTLDQYPLFIRSGAIIPLNADNSITDHGSSSSKNYLTLLVYPNGLSSFQYNSEPSNSTIITCSETSQGYTISFSKNTDSVIIRLKDNIEPENVYLNGGEELVKFNSFSDFETAESGWFRGKVNENENIYTWIKFSSPSDTVYVTNNCNIDLYPASYELSNLVEGSKYYIDRDYILNTVPNEYKGFNMIKTANADKRNTNLDFHFNVCSSADVYIAYDHRLSIPSWMVSDNYTNTGKTISVSDSYLIYFDIWERTVQSGTIHFYNIGTGPDSSMYFVFYETFSVYLKVFFQGPYAGSGSMNTTLQTSGNIPTSQPYENSPWNYSGTESVVSVPSGVVDWVLVQLRTAATPGDASTAINIVKQRAAFLMSDGSVHDIDGSNHINFSGVSPGDYYIVIKHRNHLAVMSSNAVSLPNSTVYDFTTDSTQAYGTGKTPLAYLGDGKYGMWAGDANGDGQVAYNGSSNDKNSILSEVGLLTPNNLVTGYSKNDINMDGTVSYNGISNDKNKILGVVGLSTPNNIVKTQLPK